MNNVTDVYANADAAGQLSTKRGPIGLRLLSKKTSSVKIFCVNDLLLFSLCLVGTRPGAASQTLISKLRSPTSESPLGVLTAKVHGRFVAMICARSSVQLR